MKRKAAAIAWLPVLGIVAVLFGMPSSEGAAPARDGSLTVPHDNQYGGTLAHWVVDGLPANAKAHLQRRGSTTAAWADVDDSFGIGTSNSRGHLEFDFHTPAMNSVYFRVIAGGGVSEGVHFLSKQQDAELKFVEDTPAGRLLPARGDGVAQAFAVNGESYTFKADTALLSDKNLKKPVLLGRNVTLERRIISGNTVDWKFVASATVDRYGFATFTGLTGGRDLPAGDYHVMLEHWTQNGDDIGEFPSFPFNIRVVDRPQPITTATSSAPSPTKVNLSWRAPVDPLRDHIVVTRRINSPADAGDLQVAPSLPASATTFVDTPVSAGLHYYYAVFSVSADGVWSRVPAQTDLFTPAQKGGR